MDTAPPAVTDYPRAFRAALWRAPGAGAALALAGIGCALAGAGWAAAPVPSGGLPLPVPLSPALLAPVLIAAGGAAGLARVRAQAAAAVLRAGAAAQAPALRRLMARAVRRDAYGAVAEDGRAAVAADFARRLGVPDDALAPAAALAVIEAVLGAGPVPGPSDPAGFEAWVAARLAARGWEVTPTGGTGDQGADVIARRGAESIAVQCKLASRPVGNRAVQEALAGAQFHGLAGAAVVSNAGFTRSAVDLAASAGVSLWTTADLTDPA
jgi:restriction system protein